MIREVGLKIFGRYWKPPTWKEGRSSLDVRHGSC